MIQNNLIYVVWLYIPNNPVQINIVIPNFLMKKLSLMFSSNNSPVLAQVEQHFNPGMTDRTDLQLRLLINLS